MKWRRGVFFYERRGSSLRAHQEEYHFRRVKIHFQVRNRLNVTLKAMIQNRNFCKTHRCCNMNEFWTRYLKDCIKFCKNALCDGSQRISWNRRGFIVVVIMPRQRKNPNNVLQINLFLNPSTYCLPCTDLVMYAWGCCGLLMWGHWFEFSF